MIGKKLGQYEIVEEIGAGGMGTVYRARQISLNRDVALKVLAAHQALDPAALERFKREGAAVARIAHPNIVQILDVAEDQGLHFIAMEFVEGHTVSQLLRQSGPFGYRDAVYICSQIASALGAVHKQDLIHRDVKPSNILVKEDYTAKLTDFGVATLSGTIEGDRLTLTGAAVGTPYYMSPEQVKAREVLTGASDVYSLGVVLYEMLTGAHPFGETSPTEAFSRVLNDSLPPVRRHRGDIPDDLERLLQRCVEKDKADRYPDGAALHEALEKVRLRLEMAEAAQGDAPEEYRKRVTGTGFFYVDAAQKSEARLAVQMRSLLRELVAQVRDPNKRKRREVQRLYTQSLLAREEYKRGEKQVEELRKRQKYHQDKALQHKAEAQNLIGEGKAEETAASAEKESNCEKLALDYGHQADELGKQVQEQRDEYDRRREAHAQVADELALLDAEARRAGKPIPAGGENAGLTRLARALRYGILALIAVLVLAAGWWAVSMWRAPKKASPQVTVVPPHPKQPVRPLPATSARKDGLVLHYTFDKDAGTNVLDQSGQGNDGIANGARWGANGRFGGAMSFDGLNDYIEIDRDVLRKSSGESFSLSVWFRLDEWPLRAGNAGAAAIFGLTASVGDAGRLSKIRQADARTFDYALLLDTKSSNLIFCVGRAWAEWDNDWATYRVETGRWYQAVAVYDGGPYRLYVDGREQSRRTYTLAAASRPSRMLGAIGNNHDLQAFKGRIDEVRIYNRALSAGEVMGLYTDALPPPPAPLTDGLVLHLPFDGNAQDASGNEHHGTVYGATRAADRNGSPDRCYRFSGSSNWIRVDIGCEFFTNTFTLSAWVNFADFASDYPMIMSAQKLPFIQWHGMGPVYGQNMGKVGFLLWPFDRANALISADRLETNQWYHVSVVRNGLDFMMYVNGQLSDQRRMSRDHSLTGSYIKIGNDVEWNEPYECFHGRLDDIRIYGRALSAAEVLQLYMQASPSAPAPGPVLHYTFDKDEGGKVTDKSGMGHHGTVAGATWVPLGDGGAYDFDGKNNEITAAPFETNLFRDQLAISVWFKRRNSGEDSYVVGAAGESGEMGFALYYADKGRETGYKAIVRDAQPWTGCWTYTRQGFEDDLNRWVHLAMVYDGKELVLYRNGESISCDTSCGGNVQFGKSPAWLTVGGYQSNEYFRKVQEGGDVSVYSRYLAEGVIDNVRLYNRAVSATEVRALYLMERETVTGPEAVPAPLPTNRGLSPASPNPSNIKFDGIDWVPMHTEFEVRGDKLVSLPRARKGFDYGHGGHGRGASVLTGIGSRELRDYSVEMEVCATGVDPAFNAHGLGPEFAASTLVFRLADAKESWNEKGFSGCRFTASADGTWELAVERNTYMAVPRGYGSLTYDDRRTLASGSGLKLERQNGNRVRIDVRGARVQIWFDNEAVCDITDERLLDEIGGVRLDHGGFGVAWGLECMGWIRNVTVKPL